MRQENTGRTDMAKLFPLLESEALACRGGGEAEDPIRQLLDWVTGTPPRPDQWPPQIA